MEKERRIRMVLRKLYLNIDRVDLGYNLESLPGGFCPMLTDILIAVVGKGLGWIGGGFEGLYLVIKSNKSRV